MKYYIISGEASGDLHGSNLAKEIFKKDANAEIRGWGGDLMLQNGVTLAKHYRELSFMGFLEVLKNISTIRKNISFCKSDIAAYKPDVVIFIDFSGFNLRIAKWAKSLKFKTAYYIAPQLWASRASRVEKIKKYIDETLVILPFESQFYKKYHHPVTFVGHPLLDAIANQDVPDPSLFLKNNGLDDKPIIALLPGSRRQEIETILEVMLSVVPKFSGYQFVIAKAPSIDKETYLKIIEKATNISMVENQTYALLRHAHAALVTSGTATLETALFRIPQVVCYKGNWISYQIAKRIITLKYISLVNLIMDKEVVKELIQNELNTSNLEKELKKILNPSFRSLLIKSYDQLKEKLGGIGASAKAANKIIELAKSR